MGQPINIDRNSEIPVMEQYRQQWELQMSLFEQGHAWSKSRIKQLGYKSMSEFCRVNKFPVTAGTVSNYLKGHSTFPLWFVPLLCYALKVTPNILLTVYGYYDPSKQSEVDQA